MMVKRTPVLKSRRPMFESWPGCFLCVAFGKLWNCPKPQGFSPSTKWKVPLWMFRKGQLWASTVPMLKRGSGLGFLPLPWGQGESPPSLLHRRLPSRVNTCLGPSLRYLTFIPEKLKSLRLLGSRKCTKEQTLDSWKLSEARPSFSQGPVCHKLF